MDNKTLKNLFITSLVFFTGLSSAFAADRLSGRVYEGDTGVEPPTSTALANVTVTLYASNNSTQLGSQIDITTTNSEGWYGLDADEGYEYYTIVETDPSTHYSVGATSVGGTVVTSNRIRYSVAAAPLSQQTLTGNKFWDKPTAPANTNPVADADGPYSGMTGHSITLDGSGSYDPDSGDSIAGYEWDLDHDGQYDDATGVSPSHTWYSAGTFYIELKVTDTHGASDTDSTIVTISQEPRECEANFFASPLSGCAPLTVNFSDASTNAVFWEWTFPGASPGSSTQENPIVTYSTPGDYSVKLKIICEGGYVDSVIVLNYIHVQQCEEEIDFGDAPDYYPTLLSDDGARHLIDPDLFLGSKIDPESNGQPDGAAMGDDNDGNDDEDGVNFMSPFVTGATANLDVTASASAVLNVWIDYNQNGSWADADEHVFIDKAVTPGLNNLTVNVPANAVTGETFARFRLTWEAGMGYDGSAENGEVEDYLIQIEPGENDNSIGDRAWDDLNHNGLQDEGEPGLDSIYVSLIDQNGNYLASTVSNLSGFYLFSNLTPGSYYLRFSTRYGYVYSPADQGTDDAIDSDANTATGETPVFSIAVGENITNMDCGLYREAGTDEYDFGDAPDPTFPTLLANDGARHVIHENVYMGSTIDGEPDGQPTADSQGDDSDGTDDEDGIVFLNDFVPGSWTSFTATVSVKGNLGGWLDFNGNGNWTDAGESVFINDTTVFAGANTWSVKVPQNAVIGNITTRFRFSTHHGQTFDGEWPDGEVEDYSVEIKESSDLGTITIIKKAYPADNTPFPFNSDFGPFTLKDPTAPSVTFAGVKPGTYNFKENIPMGWPVIAINAQDPNGGSSVDATNASASVVMDGNEHIIVTFTNYQGDLDNLDFGDAPDPTYPTLMANNGACHAIKPGFYLGSGIDPEQDGQPSALADGDNVNGVNDEHGVIMSPFIAPGQSVPVTVVASDTGVINVWFDFNINGNWGDLGEHVISAQPVWPGANLFTLNVPSGAVYGLAFARFRLSSSRQISYDGFALDGEVEDYAVEIVEQGDDGSLVVFKDANPKDNTPFLICMQMTSSFFNILCTTLMDPLNNKMTVLNPVNIQNISEATIPGWTLKDIQITGDTDNGSTVDVTAGRVDLDYDPGENIVITFKNEISENEQSYDLGDAPDGTNHDGLTMNAYTGVPARFPTVFDPATGTPQGPRHTNPKADAWLGADVSGELDADLLPDSDGLSNLDPPNDAADRDRYDDGVNIPFALPSCQDVYFVYKLTIPPGTVGKDRYVNAWFDWNRDGDWEDVFTCETQYDAPEWAVQNQLIPGGFPPGTYLFATPLFKPYHPQGKENDPIWMRITISEQATGFGGGSIGEGPANGYLYGETEDYYFVPQDTTEDAQFDFGDAPDPGYPTLLVNNGARHVIIPNFYLGSGIDSESDGQPVSMADGDDKNTVYSGLPYPSGDEDGVQIPPIITKGGTVSVKVLASAPGVLNAWLDFNINNSWADAGEHIIAAQPVIAGMNSFSFSVPATAQTGQSFARFRLSSVRNISYNGIAPDGEVEDYAVAIQGGDGGNITIIKDANPKDNTPFWISVVYGVSGGAAPYRDPMMNTATITNGPVGTYNMGESVPTGWVLDDIVVTGDADNGSSIDLGNALVDVDLDAGENITVVFKNSKSGDEELFDLGDAPDCTNHSGQMMFAYSGVLARYPTVFDPTTGPLQGPKHIHPRDLVFLGNRVSLEAEADIDVDEDPTNNILPQNNKPDLDYFDDGVKLPLVLPDCDTTSFQFSVTVVSGVTRQNFYVNVWFDWNRDGDWEDNVPCDGTTAAEWAVQNYMVTLSSGHHVLSTPSFRSTHPTFTGNPPPIWMRITITTQAADTDDGSGPANGYSYGETEDYFFTPRLYNDILYDFGDAPDDANTSIYPTLHINCGAYHDILNDLKLGGMIDAEINGQPTPDASGDDNTASDDEDGVTFQTPIIPGQSAVVQVVASDSGILNAWIDFNANTAWADVSDHIFIDVPLVAGNNMLTFNVPSTALLGPSFARFRFSKLPFVLPVGYGHAGEVEDYQVEIVSGEQGPPLKWMQWPLRNEDLDLPYTPYYIGWDVLSDYDDTFVADDWFCKAPRPVTDIHWWGSYALWDSAFPPPVCPDSFHVGIWSDVQPDEFWDWSRPRELLWEIVVARSALHERAVENDFHPDYMSKPDTCFQYDYDIPMAKWFIQEGDSTVYWLSIGAIYNDVVPDSFVWGWLTREHFFLDDAVYVYDPVQPTVGDTTIKTEPISDGWDMAFVLGTDDYFLEFDYGDAPMERYPTLFGQNGPLHIIDPLVFLGERIDPEDDGQPDFNCTGDDNDGNNDDDGIIFIVSTETDPNTYVKITASCPGFVNAWMDFDNNADWTDPEDRILYDEPVPGGQSVLPIPVPQGFESGTYFSRFRFSTQPGLTFVGIAIDGEVEDYYADLSTGDVKVADNTNELPKDYQLYQNYPNPFNSTTEIRYDLPKDGYLRMSIYNLTGAEVRLLVNKFTSAGSYQLRWDGRDNHGQIMSTGIYLLVIDVGDYRTMRKVVLLK